jgi:S-adenosylmethionine:tRNA ribosyltransferase-isomerase
MSRIWDEELSAERIRVRRAEAALEASRYRTHEFGDSMWIERRASSLRASIACTTAAISAPP